MVEEFLNEHGSTIMVSACTFALLSLLKSLMWREDRPSVNSKNEVTITKKERKITSLSLLKLNTFVFHFYLFIFSVTMTLIVIIVIIASA